ncbi:hypothetical protein D9613_012810 [Agrocybe pediades]|uniref:L-ornithine N(5)-monooxygenase [NAD(P)H] n=1 Tax=Agrocybe pediades TaxID=84607 RepID=A0A8H4VVQ2_9AGAR|nr:hypothetical protein D9613_012810 [Agrocybe pediades]
MNSQYAASISQIFQKFDSISRRSRVAVIGSGQSAAEVTMDLRERLSKIPSDGRHIVEMITICKGSLKPSDDSPFANEIFDPAASLATNSWNSKLAEYKLTNYGVDQRLATAVAHCLGEGALQTEAWIEIKPYTEIVDTASAADLLLSPENIPPRSSPFVVKTQSIIHRAETEEQYDAIVYATGYERSSWVNILKNSDITPHFGLNPLSRNVRLVPTSTTIRSQSCLSCLSSGSNSGASTPSNPSSAQSSPPTSPDIESFPKEKDSLSLSLAHAQMLPWKLANSVSQPTLGAETSQPASDGPSSTFAVVARMDFIGDGSQRAPLYQSMTSKNANSRHIQTPSSELRAPSSSSPSSPLSMKKLPRFLQKKAPRDRSKLVTDLGSEAGGLSLTGSAGLGSPSSELLPQQSQTTAKMTKFLSNANAEPTVPMPPQPHQEQQEEASMKIDEPPR